LAVPISPFVPSPPPSLALGDAGASGHYLTDQHKICVNDLHFTGQPLTITFPKGISITSTLQILVRNLPSELSASTTTARIFSPTTLSTSRISIIKLCSADCGVICEQARFTIYDLNDTLLWNFVLNRLDDVDGLMVSQTLANGVRFVHVVFRAPALPSFMEAARENRFLVRPTPLLSMHNRLTSWLLPNSALSRRGSTPGLPTSAPAGRS